MAGFGIEAGGGFVEEEELRIADQAEGQVETATLATGQLTHSTIALGGEVERVEQRVDVERFRVIAGEGVDELGDRELVVLGSELEHRTDP